MTDETSAAFVETREYRRFREFCDACRRDRYIGLCYGPPGVGKTLSARRYADWDRVEATDPIAGRGAFGPGEVPGNGSVFFTVKVVNSPGQIERDIIGLRERVRELVVQAIRAGTVPRIFEAQQELREAQADYLRNGDWPGGEALRIRAAQAALSEAMHGMVERTAAIGEPTDLVLVDEADRLRMAGLDQLRDLFDRGGIGLVLIGMPGLERRLARYAHLYSRIGFVHEFRPLGSGEVRAVLSGWRPRGVALPADLLSDAEGVAALIRITGGNFRLLDRVLAQVGRILALNGLGVMTREVVEAAREVLVIGTA